MKIFIPPELADLQPELKRFIDAMVFKLRRNAHKGKWEGLDLAETMTRLVDEVHELDAAIKECNDIEIVLEAADVANFAMILAAIAIVGAGNGTSVNL